MKLERAVSGDRIELRDYRDSDREFCTEMWFHPENGRYLSDPDQAHVDGKFRRALDSLEDNKDGFYCVAWLKNGQRLGTCCLFPEEDGSWDIGYCVHRRYWGRGYGTEIVGLLIEYVRGQGGKSLTAEVAKENAPSNALLKKLGFQAEREGEFSKYNMPVRYESWFYRLWLTESGE